jgi:hypothetical protein
MKPPTEEQLNQEIDDGYGLQWEGEPSWVVQAEIDRKNMEIDAMEVTMEMTIDRWRKEENYLLTVIRLYENSLEFEMEWQDEVDQVAVAHEQERLQEAKSKHSKEKEEFEEERRRQRRP